MAGMDPRRRAPSVRMAENPRRPTSTSSLDSDSNEDVFDRYFDWPRYCESTVPHDDPALAPSSHRRRGSRSPRSPLSPGSSPRSSPRSSPPRDLSPRLDTLIPELPSYLRDHDVQALESGFYRMNVMPYRRESRGSNAASEYSGYSAPELVRGGSSSPSYSSGSVIDPREAAAFGHPADFQGHSPPALSYGGSSPSSHSPTSHSPPGSLFDPRDVAPHDQGYILQDVQAHDDEWTYPPSAQGLKIAPRGYPSQLQFHEDARTSGTKRRRSGEDLIKRQRHLADPYETAVVRKTGACMPCRVSKTKCDGSGVCAKCRHDFKDFPDQHLVCIRSTPAMMWPVIGKLPNIWTHYASEEQRLCAEPQFHFGEMREISIFFHDHSSVAPLRLLIQEYNDGRGSSSSRAFAIPRERMPSYDQLQYWAEGLIRSRRRGDFQHMVEILLMAYAHEGQHLPKHRLVNKVHQMNCFFKIWKQHAFSRKPGNSRTASQMVPLPVQAQLRDITRRALNSFEHDVLKELDDIVTQQGNPKPQERLAIWISMWQLMLMYREILGQFQQHLLGPEHEAAYFKLHDQFLPMLATFYHYQFRTKKSLDALADWVKPGPLSCDVPSVRHFAQQLLDTRKDTYCGFQESSNEIDHLLCVFVVNHELKKLNARKRKPVTKSKTGYAYDDYDE